MTKNPCPSVTFPAGRNIFCILFFCSTLALLPMAAWAQTTLTNGALVAGTLAANTTNVYTFDANAGDTILLRVGSPTFNPSIVLKNQLGTVVASAGSGSSGARDPNIAAQAANAGTYSVEISSIFAGGTGAYNLNLARIPGPFVVSPGDDGGLMTNGWEYSGTNSLGDMDIWTFSANAGDSIILKMGSASFNPWIRVYGPNGLQVATAGSGVSGFLSVDLQTIATNAGTYTVVTSSFFQDSFGNYTLNLAQSQSTAAVYVAPGDQGGPMINGWEHKGFIDLGDLDVWTFSANAGDNVELHMGATNYNPYIRLLGPSGTQVAAAGNGVSGFQNVDLATIATNGGVYTVVVGNFGGNATGSYILNLFDSSQPVFVAPGDDGGPMTNGWEHRGFVDLGDLDAWTFNANAGDRIVLRMGATNYNPWIRLYGPDGKSVAAAGSGVSGFQNVDLAATATNAGTYTVVVGNFGGNAIGSYILNLAQSPGPVFVAPGDEGGLITNGWKFTGSLDLGDLDVWTFDANPGDNLVFRMASPFYNPWIRVYRPDGKLAASAGTGVAGNLDVSFSMLATNGGSYTAVISSFNGNGFGSYLFNMLRLPAPFFTAPGDEGGTLVNGSPRNGTIDAGDMDIFRFGVCRADTIALSVQKLTGTFTPRIRLYARDGTLLGTAFNTTVASIGFTPTNSGVFTAIIDGNGVNDSGTYLLTGNGFTDELNLCPPIIVSGTNLDFAGTGGNPNATFVLYSSTNLTAPQAQWKPILTNHFDSFGAFELTNSFNPTNPPVQYFWMAEPQ